VGVRKPTSDVKFSLHQDLVQCTKVVHYTLFVLQLGRFRFPSNKRRKRENSDLIHIDFLIQNFYATKGLILNDF
jgi:hypothetical protein